jgi:hypothetical protein
VFKCFVGLDTELGNMVANHARALEGYFPPAVNLKKVRVELWRQDFMRIVPSRMWLTGPSNCTGNMA